MRYTPILLFLFITSLLGCSDLLHPDPEISKDIDHIADLQCQARALKQERIALADTMRYREEGLISEETSVSTKDSLRQLLDNMTEEKEDIYQRTKTMADSIQALQRHLWKHHFPEPKDRFVLDSLIHTSFIKNCPLAEEFEKEIF